MKKNILNEKLSIECLINNIFLIHLSERRKKIKINRNFAEKKMSLREENFLE